jgi:hypothetical protein
MLYSKSSFSDLTRRLNIPSFCANYNKFLFFLCFFCSPTVDLSYVSSIPSYCIMFSPFSFSDILLKFSVYYLIFFFLGLLDSYFLYKSSISERASPSSFIGYWTTLRGVYKSSDVTPLFLSNYLASKVIKVIGLPSQDLPISLNVIISGNSFYNLFVSIVISDKKR